MGDRSFDKTYRPKSGSTRVLIHLTRHQPHRWIRAEVDNPEQAAPLLLDVLEGYDTSHAREVALYRSWLGEAYAKAGDVERACAETMHVLDAVEGVNSARVDGRLLVLRRALRPYADVPVVHAIEERSQAVTTTA